MLFVCLKLILHHCVWHELAVVECGSNEWTIAEWKEVKQQMPQNAGKLLLGHDSRCVCDDDERRRRGGEKEKSSPANRFDKLLILKKEKDVRSGKANASGKRTQEGEEFDIGIRKESFVSWIQISPIDSLMRCLPFTVVLSSASERRKFHRSESIYKHRRQSLVISKSHHAHVCVCVHSRNCNPWIFH